MTRMLFVVVALLLALPALAARTFAVMEFANGSGQADFDPLGKGLQSMFIVDLAKLDGFEVVDRSAVNEVGARLGLKGLVEGSEAARVGKEAGATHLLAGAFQIVNGAMHLDARVVDVASGRVLLSQGVDGEQDAFFELQKDMVKKVVASLDRPLEPRERAAIGRIHTADFVAFQDFSRGLSLFDQERYEESLEALRAATTRDEEFTLAKLTLADYEQLITKLRARAENIHALKAEQERLKRLGEAGEDVEIVRKLLEAAAAPGAAARDRRLAALYNLAVAYSNVGTRKSKLMALRRVEDRFAMQRAADELARRYYNEALPLWPQVPLVPDEDDFYSGEPDLADFDAWLDEAAKRLRERGSDHPENRISYMQQNIRYPRELARFLHLDLAGEVRLREELNALAKVIPPRPYWVEEQNEALVEEYRKLLRVDDSTRLLEKKARDTDNEYALKGIADKVEDLRDLKAALGEGKDPALLREWLLLSSWSQSTAIKFARENLLSGSPTPKGAMQVDRNRKIPSNNDQYLLVGEVPTWFFQGFWVTTGRRTDPRRTDALRYHRTTDKDQLDQLVLAGAVAREEVHASFRLQWEPPADWWPSRQSADDTTTWADRQVTPGRPEVAFLLGARDIDVQLHTDPVTKERLLSRPMQAWRVRITPDRVALEKIVESERGSYDRKAKFDVEVVGEKVFRKKVGTGAKVDIVAAGGKVRVDVGGNSEVFTARDLSAGFTGFQIIGLGFVEIADLEISGAEAGRPPGG